MTSHGRTLGPPMQEALFKHPAESAPQHLVLPAELPTTAHESRDVFNAWLLDGLTLAAPFDIPLITAQAGIPTRLICFSEATGKHRAPDRLAWVHWYEDDVRMERFWARPDRYLDRLRQYGGVISPDFSVYRNMPRATKIHNTFRNQALGAWLQVQGLQVIANVRLSGRESIPYALAGVPHRATLALGLHGCVKDVANRVNVAEELRLVCDLCEPTDLVVYGSAASGVLDYPVERGIRVHLFTPDSRRRSVDRRAA